MGDADTVETALKLVHIYISILYVYKVTVLLFW